MVQSSLFNYKHIILISIASTDEGKDSSNPAQSGIRNSNCFGSKGLMMFENLRYKTISATQNFNHETI